MKKREFRFEFECATITCACSHYFACAPSEYEVQIIVDNHVEKEMLVSIGIFEYECDVCARIYERWLKGNL